MTDFSDLAPPAHGKQAAIFQSVLDGLRSRGTLLPNERVVLGVSGGADSTALALLLSPLRLREGVLALDLFVAHFDHQLRGITETGEDRRFVEELCGRLHIPVTFGSDDVRSFAREKHLSIEDAARRLRYAFLGDHATKVDAAVVAVGHTADDQAETVLLHLIRGSSLKGLRGMTPRSSWPFGAGPEVARPLLGLSGSETELYCELAGFEPRRDPTNQSLEHTRNRVRHLVLPAMREINPRVNDALVRLASFVESDLDHLEREADGIWDSVSEAGETKVRFPRNVLSELDPALTSRLLIRAADHMAGADHAPTHAHLQRARELIVSTRNRWRTSFPGGLDVSATGGFVDVSVAGCRTAEPSIPNTLVALPGMTEIGNWVIDVKKESAPADREANGLEAFIAEGAIHGELRVRSREKGDRLRPIGLNGTKKLQDIFVDAKTPAEQRDGTPLICDDQGILWVVGHCLDERSRMAPSAKEVVHITARRKS